MTVKITGALRCLQDRWVLIQRSQDAPLPFVEGNSLGEFSERAAFRDHLSRFGDSGGTRRSGKSPKMVLSFDEKIMTRSGPSSIFGGFWRWMTSQWLVNGVVFLAQEMMVFAMKKLGFSPDFPVTAWISVGFLLDQRDEALTKTCKHRGGTLPVPEQGSGWFWVSVGCVNGTCIQCLRPFSGEDDHEKYEFHSWLSLWVSRGPKNSCQGNVQKQPMSRESSTNGFLVSCWGSIFNGWGWVCLSVSLFSSRFVWVSAHGTRIQDDRHRQSVSVEAVHCNHPIWAGDPIGLTQNHQEQIPHWFSLIHFVSSKLL